MATFKIFEDSEKKNTAPSCTYNAINRNIAGDSKTAFRDITNLEGSNGGSPVNLEGRSDGIPQVALAGTLRVHGGVSQFTSTETFEEKYDGSSKLTMTGKVNSNFGLTSNFALNGNFEGIYDDTSQPTLAGNNDSFNEQNSDSASSHSDNLHMLDKDESSHQQLVPRNDRERFYDVEAYLGNILEYFRENEKKHRPKPDYMSYQKEISAAMRAALIDWIISIVDLNNLQNETLHLTVSLIDRFLSKMSVTRCKFQLVGVTALYIAAKYEENHAPDAKNIALLCNGKYTIDQIFCMEQIMLKTLSFELCTTTMHAFVNAYAVEADMTEQLKYLALYISELSLLHTDPYLKLYPSIISAAAIALARHTLKYSIWSVDLEKITKYSFNDLREVIHCLWNTYCNATTLSQRAILEKYKADKYSKVSEIKAVDLNIEDETTDIVMQDNKEGRAHCQE